MLCPMAAGMASEVFMSYAQLWDRMKNVWFFIRMTEHCHVRVHHDDKRLFLFADADRHCDA
jgi:hypothetical protein